MAWLQLRINSNDQQAESLSEILTELGAISVTFMDSHDTPIFEPQIGETRLWGDTDVMALFDANTNMIPIVEQLKSLGFINSNAYKIEQIEDKDWVREWMDQFHPIQFGQRLWICPSWREAPDPTGVNIMLDPGLAFGTGTHPTTSLCLQWLDSLDLNHKKLIDFGCGSGILAIAGLKLGAENAIGIDIDPQAIIATVNNARKNQVENRLQLFLAQHAPNDLQADVVVANILAGPLTELYPNIHSLLKPQGLLCLSGILTTQAEMVTKTYQQGFEIKAITELDEWCRIVAIKK